ncbi:MAG: DNA internalization-related competence protein ComEC/Rec2 [Acidobacteriia bacterium]|nr:DNA internalization-related competence protein ComEC/Rec2 [Terriglobia bacterium]
MPAREPLLLPLAALAGGIFVSRLMPFTPAEAGLSMAALIFLTCLACLPQLNKLATVPALAAIFFSGVLLDLWRKPGSPPIIDFEPGETMILSGCVVEPPVLFPEREQFVMELEPGARVRVQLYFNKGDQPPRLPYGRMVELEARLRAPRNYRNPGSFDYVGYLARRNIYWTASARPGSPVRLLDVSCGARWRAALFHLRQITLDRLDRIYSGNAYAIGLTRAVLVGDISRLEKVWMDDFRRSGTYHALVISGLHITTLAGCFLFLFRLVRVSPGLSFVLTTLIAWVYALMAGGNTPVLRAAAGLTLYTVARYFYRTPQVLNLLAAIAIAFLIADPEQLFDPSFHLSFLAVALIGAIGVPALHATSTPYMRALPRPERTHRDAKLEPAQASFRIELRLVAETIQFLTRLPFRWGLRLVSLVCRVALFAWELILISAVVQIGLTLPMIVYFHRVSLAGLTANLIIVPLTNLLVPLGLLTVLSGWEPLIGLTSAMVAWCGSAAQWHASLDPNWRIPDPPAWLIAAFMIALVLLAAGLRAGRLWRLASGFFFAILLGVLVLHPFPPLLRPGALELTAIDVGQGDSLLVVSPNGQTMIVDAGGIPGMGRKQAGTFDIGEEVVSPYLWSRSIQSIDTLVITHAHEDHIGGAAALLENLHPRRLWIGALADTPSWHALRRKAQQRGVQILSPRAGENLTWGGVQVQVLSPPKVDIPSARVSNNESLVLRLTYGRTSFLLTGDMERQVELRLLAEGLLQKTDVLKVAHHGSKTSSTAEFIDAVGPTFALISDGAGNIFHHPHPDVLQRLRERGISTWRTDLHGQLTIFSDGHRIQLQTYSWPLPTQPRLAPRSAF